MLMWIQTESCVLSSPPCRFCFSFLQLFVPRLFKSPLQHSVPSTYYCLCRSEHMQDEWSLLTELLKPVLFFLKWWDSYDSRCVCECDACLCDGVGNMPPGLTSAIEEARISQSSVTSSQTAASQGWRKPRLERQTDRAPSEELRLVVWAGSEFRRVSSSLYRETLCSRTGSDIQWSVEAAANCRELDSWSKFRAHVLSATPTILLRLTRDDGEEAFCFLIQDSHPQQPSSWWVHYLAVQLCPVRIRWILFHHHQRRRVFGA